MKIDLVQRGTFKENVKDADVTGIDSVIRFDYMGSAEFEFGALPASLKAFLPVFPLYDVHPTQYKTKDGTNLFILCHKDMLEAVHTGLVFMTQDRDGGMYMKEHSRMYDVLNQEPITATPPKTKKAKADRERALLRRYDINFWWDIQNHWFAVLGKDNVDRLKLGLERLRQRWIDEKKITPA